MSFWLKEDCQLRLWSRTAWRRQDPAKVSGQNWDLKEKGNWVGWRPIAWVRYNLRSLRERDFPGSLVVENPHLHCRGTGSIPGQGAKTLHAVQCGQKKRDREAEAQWLQSSAGLALLKLV